MCNRGSLTGRCALCVAIGQGDTAAVAALLETGVSARRHAHEAAQCGVHEIVTLVLGHGGRANERNAAGETPLFVAARLDRADLATTLLRKGADARVRCKAGYRAVDLAPINSPLVVTLAPPGRLLLLRLPVYRSARGFSGRPA